MSQRYGPDAHFRRACCACSTGFYTKARANKQLSGFYDACAQVEIDEYRDYEKALGALKEATKQLIKAKDLTGSEKEERLNSLQQRIFVVERFATARKQMKEGDPREAMDACRSLLDHPEIETAIRVGDVFALMVEQEYSVRNYQAALELIEMMESRNIIVAPYLDADMVNTIYSRT